MAPVTNARTLYNEHPTGYPIPGKTTVHDVSQKIDLDDVKLNGGILVKTLVLAIDPYLRAKMRKPEVKNNIPVFIIGEPITNYGVGVILRSESSEFNKGDHVMGILPFQEYVVCSSQELSRLQKLTSDGIPWETYIGTLGSPGKTAFFGWKEYSKAKKGETVFVSSAASSVGSLVVELAKLDGLKVIASAGSDEKVQFVRSLGADVAFNYKKESTKEALEREGPIDIYWDNVGGETLDLALAYANANGRFLQCGAISAFNDPSAPGIKNYMQITRKQLTLYGFHHGALQAKWGEEFSRIVAPLVKEGKIHSLNDVSKGLETAGQGILDVQQGKNVGKRVILVAEE